jgi:hypothetical protein
VVSRTHTTGRTTWAKWNGRVIDEPFELKNLIVNSTSAEKIGMPARIVTWEFVLTRAAPARSADR